MSEIVGGLQEALRTVALMQQRRKVLKKERWHVVFLDGYPPGNHISFGKDENR